MIRRSDERGRGDALLSPDIQRTAITDHAARAGYSIVDSSARTRRRVECQSV